MQPAPDGRAAYGNLWANVSKKLRRVSYPAYRTVAKGRRRGGRSTRPAAAFATAGEAPNLCTSSSPYGTATCGEARYPVSPTPSRLTGTGGVEARRDALTALRPLAGPFDAVNDVNRSRRLEVAIPYFFFRRFVLRAPFFAADFVFVFRFFAMLPS